MAVARVIVDVGLDRAFDYRVPADLAADVAPGVRVVVPFGKRIVEGVVLSLAETSAHGALKDLVRLAGRRRDLDEPQLNLARWIAGYYGAPIELAVRAMMPAAVRHARADFKKQAVLRLTEAGRARLAADAPALPPRQAAVLRYIAEHEGAVAAAARREGGVTDAPLRALRRAGLVRVEDEHCRRDPFAHRELLPTQPLPLESDQRAALAQIAVAIDAVDGATPPKPILLHGVTGSGKTEVYLQAIAHALAVGRGAIVLVPEIALTPQTVERFVGRFGPRVAVLHSALNDGERHDEWHRIRAGDADIVIGARSAVFAPVRKLGLIVVDEEHEPSYKQDESPRYHARDVAVVRGAQQSCAVVLGSATPALESWQNARTGKYRLAALPNRVDGCRLPAIRVVDMRAVAQERGQPSVFSRDLLAAIEERLARGEQIILFLNRRGFATSRVCPKCGHVARCEACSVALTYHRTDDTLRCHICGASHPPPAVCPNPECRDPAFRYAGVGTQRIETILARCFPRARVQRVDADSMQTRHAHERVFLDFRARKVDILIGTQMIAKGLHFPNVTLVGVLHADMSLHLPDFRAGERTFQLLAQVAGRAGRGEMPGEVIVQTYTPFHPAVQAARRADYAGFADQELEFRRELAYPPFTHLACLHVRGEDEEQVRGCATTLAGALAAALRDQARVSEGAPAPLAKAKHVFRYQVMARGASARRLVEACRNCMNALCPPKSVQVWLDMDPVNLL